MAASAIQLSFPAEDIALLSLDTPGKSANILSKAMLEEFDEKLSEVEQKSGVAGLIITSAKPGMFIAGADLREFAASLDSPADEIFETCRRGQNLFRRLSQCDFVTVAAIDGICVGGGAELAVWCDRRIMSQHPKAEIGFPEVKLGLFPGWGGTVRLPRIAGLGNAVEMITTGDSINATDAYKSGLVSDVTPSDDLTPAAIRMIRDEQQSGQFKHDRQTWSQPIAISETELTFLGLTAAALIKQTTKGKYPAPEAALETMLEGSMLAEELACELEARGMSKLFGTPVNAALLNVFFLTDRNKKDNGLSTAAEDSPAAAEIRTAGVLGAGIMGSGIVAANLKRGVRVELADASEESLARGAAAAIEEASYDRSIKGASVEKTLEIAPLLNVAATAELATCDLVIEAVVEKASVKKKIYAELEPLMASDAILATNTSTLPITGLAEGLSRPEQFCGIHFFNPVRRMKLVEIIRGVKTSDQTVATAVAYAKRLGKMPVVVNDGPGFLVNRLLFPYLNEALQMYCQGVPIAPIEKAATAFGMPMGPFALYDMVGLDTAVYAGLTMWESFPDRVPKSPLLPAMVKAGRLGRKSGKGFFSYENRKKTAQPDPTLEEVTSQYRTVELELEHQQITDRLILPMLLEATRVLEAGIVRDVRDVDLGLIFGLGFPPFKGGLLHWADTLGAEEIISRLAQLPGMATRSEPTTLLKSMAEQGQRFYD